MTAPNIMIALLAYGGSIKLDCFKSLSKLQNFFYANNVSHRLMTLDINGADVARNIAASRFYAETDCTHLLFIDSDMMFEPKAVIRLVSSNKPIIAPAYVRRTATPEFVVELLDKSKPVTIENGLCRVSAVGMGLTLISRDVFVQLLSTGKIRTLQAHPYQGASGLQGPLHGFFDPTRSETAEMSEDVSFCARWRTECGGEVWAVLDEDIGHIGEFTYRGKLSDSIV